MSGRFGSCRSKVGENVYSREKKDSDGVGSCRVVSVWSECSSECFAAGEGVENGLLACAT